MSDAERRLWQQLRRRQLCGCRFRRQHPMGPYIVDFVCIERRLVIEVDGGQHAGHMKQDARRTAWLESRGFRVLRFWNTEVLQETEVVMEVIAAHLESGWRGHDKQLSPSPALPRKRGRE